MPKQNPRELLAEADRHRRRADAAESFRTSIRLGRKPTIRERILRITYRDREQQLDEITTMAVYEALAIVRDDHQALAAAIEARVEVTDDA